MAESIPFVKGFLFLFVLFPVVIGHLIFWSSWALSAFFGLTRGSYRCSIQGMNFVAAMLLLVMKKEEDAFWMLAVLVENVLFDDCYSENLYGCHVEQRVFKDLLRKKLPRSDLHPGLFLIFCFIYDSNVLVVWITLHGHLFPLFACFNLHSMS